MCIKRNTWLEFHYFRFDAETIQGRKDSILNFLDFIGNNQQLFTSTEFVKFLEVSKEYY